MASASLILLWAVVILRADSLPDKKSLLLPPTNFTINVTGLAQVLLRWEPNPDQEPGNVELGYRVRINAPQEEDYETRNTESKRVTVLHQGFSASVQTIPWDGHSLLASNWVSAELKAPPGSPGTSIVNLTCTTTTMLNNSNPLRPYQVSLYCTWLVGKDAPEDTQYFFYYRYGSSTEECQEYRKDTLKRNIACWFPRTFIRSRGSDLLAVHANGSSQRAAIKPLDQLFALHAIDRINPPVNVTAEIEGNYLSIQWEKPISAFPIHCFEYEVKIYNARKNYFQTEKMTTNTFISITDDISKYSIQVRAAVSSVCRQTGLWSEWSQTVYVGNDDQKPSTEWFLIVLVATICFILLIFTLICKIGHLWARLFPPVPAPKNSLKDFLVIVSPEKTVSSETEIEVISYVEESELETLEDSVF
ncbi:interleukin-5 receptor subunit alpha [Mustela lutreola]|uniref:interleukin-5 receptor subunit alpha n=1 Tax=Mustela lutreola TaxID=9666 RepID=UPI002797373D|nr:interleukin-5 receptor subunit alpha [Mustela lutreola]